MTAQFFVDKTDECYTVLYSGLLSVAQTGDPEAIHQFRVNVKSFIGLMAFLNEFKSDALWPKEIVARLKPYYKLSGKIRNINVVQELLNVNFEQVSNDFYTYLDGQLCRRRNEFELLTSAIDIPEPETIKKEVSQLMDASFFSKEILQRHLSDNKDRALCLISKNGPSEAWHAARTFLKRNFLLSKLLLSASMNDATQSEGRKLEQELGVWHDIVVLTKTYDRYLLTTDRSSVPFFREQLRALKQSREKLIYQSTMEVV
jgi:CHAD domain-containing protein